MTSPTRMTLQKDVAGSILAGHPWVWRDAIAPARAAPGELVEITDRGGRYVATGFAQAGPIAARVLATKRGSIDAARLTLEGAGQAMPEELVLVDLQAARHAIEEIAGRRTTEDMLAHIFERFCIGK